uniref:Uncharacterized protein n=1 Tax=Romanomermis culicivorax TaxID=13658 RepID=A0A915JT86_ROMCU
MKTSRISTSVAGSESEPAADDRSTCSRRKKHRRHECCKHMGAKDPSNEQSRRRPRDVKRADDDRQKRQAQKIVQVGNDLASSDSAPDVRPRRPLPPGAVPVLPPGTISIPQNIVIPGATDGQHSTQPQKYHINSEITIRYDRKDDDGDENEQRRRFQHLHKNQSNMIASNINDSGDFSSVREGQRSTPSTMPVGSTMGSGSNMAIRNARGTFSGVNGESKRYASTAV